MLLSYHLSWKLIGIHWESSILFLAFSELNSTSTCSERFPRQEPRLTEGMSISKGSRSVLVAEKGAAERILAPSGHCLAETRVLWEVVETQAAD